MSKFLRSYRSKVDSETDLFHSHLSHLHITEPDEKVRISSLDRQNTIFTPRSVQKTLESWTFFDEKPIIMNTEIEYIKKIEILNEIERRKYPKIFIEEAHKIDQENAPAKAEIDSTGLIRTAINENTWLHVDIPKHEYIYFSIPVKSRDSPLKLVIQKAAGQESTRDDLKIFISEIHHRPSSFKYTEVFTTKIAKIRTKNHKTKFDLEELYFSLFSETFFSAKLRYSFGDDFSATRQQSNQLQKTASTSLLPSIHAQKENNMAQQKETQLLELEMAAKEILRRRRLKVLEKAKGSDFVKKNKETASQVAELEQYRVHLRQKNSLRIIEAQRNKRIREHESVEKKRFLTEKHDLLRSVTFLHRMHEHNQLQTLTKQKIWLEFLFFNNFCRFTFEKFKRRSELLIEQRKALFKVKVAIRRINNQNSLKGKTTLERMQNEIHMSLLTHTTQLHVSAKKQAKKIVYQYMIDRYKVNKLCCRLLCFRNRIINVQTRWMTYLRKKHNYKRVLEIVWDQFFVAIAVEMQNRKGNRNSIAKRNRTAVKVESETQKKKNFVEQYYNESFSKFKENFFKYRDALQALKPEIRKTLDYGKFLTHNDEWAENSMLTTKLDHMDHNSISILDVDLIYKRQKSTLYYPDSLFFPPRLFMIPTVAEMKDYLKEQQKTSEAQEIESKTAIIINKSVSHSPELKKRSAIFSTQPSIKS